MSKKFKSFIKDDKYKFIRNTFTDLMECKEVAHQECINKRKPFILFKDFLDGYGIYFTGGQIYRNKSGVWGEGVKYHELMFDRYIPIENIQILKYLYPKESTINVVLDLSGSYKYDFCYDRNNGFCILNKRYCDTNEIIEQHKFVSFKFMMEVINGVINEHLHSSELIQAQHENKIYLIKKHYIEDFPKCLKIAELKLSEESMKSYENFVYQDVSYYSQNNTEIRKHLKDRFPNIADEFLQVLGEDFVGQLNPEDKYRLALGRLNRDVESIKRGTVVGCYDMKDNNFKNYVLAFTKNSDEHVSIFIDKSYIDIDNKTENNE